MTIASFKIDNYSIDNSSPCFIIAEMSANHGGSLDKAIEIIRQAKSAGADAVKLQTYRADTITINCDQADFCLPTDSPWQTHQTLYSLYEKAYTPWSWHKTLFDEAKKLGLSIFSSPFDATAVDFLEELDVCAYKIASPEITDIPLIRKVAQTGKPVIFSTGIADLNDIELAVDTLRENGCHQFVILKCTTAYPTPYSECNLKTITDMTKRFNCFAGLSDHSIGNAIPIAAVTLGAKVIEKHFTLDDNHEAVDDFFSLKPSEFKKMVEDIRNVESAMGKVDYTISKGAQKNILARRSLYVCKSMKAGDRITSENIKSVRPGYGLHPKYYNMVLGKEVKVDLNFGDRLLAEDIANFDERE